VTAARSVGRRSPVGRALLAVVGFYSRAISPALPPRCRFYPTCSAYAAEAIARHGAARGTWLAVRRIVRCGPWHPGGVDLVPDVVLRPAQADGPGTPSLPHSSCSSEALPTAPVARATRPVPHRAPQEESSVA
jgi:hypothetical protein